MPRNGTGVYTLPQAPFVPSTVISSAAVNSDLSDLAAALTDSIAADGQTPIAAPLLGAAGTKALPGWTFASDNTSGLFSGGTGIVGLSAGGGAVGIEPNAVAFKVSAAAPSAAGSGYAVNDTIVLAGGTGVLATILTVTSLSGSGVASASVLIGGNYSTLPINPAAQSSTSGSGSGATFTLTSAPAVQVSDLNGVALWQDFGATPYMAGSMGAPNGAALALYIGAVNLAAAISTSLPIPPPEGYLTPISNTPVITGDSVAATTIFWTPLNGFWTPIHNGTQIIPYQISGQLPLTLTSSQSSLGIYDIFLAYNAGVPVIGTGPNWTAGTAGSVTAGSCARGTGSGGTSLTRLQGINVNAVSMSLIWNTGTGNTTITVPANQGIYLGSIFIDAAAGQVSCYVSWGSSRKFGIWNLYNQRTLSLRAGDSTASWNTAGNVAIRESRAQTTNNLTVFCGLAQTNIDLGFVQKLDISSDPSSTISVSIGVGVNSTAAFSGLVGSGGTFAGSAQVRIDAMLVSRYIMPPALGINQINSLETTSGVSGTPVVTWFGTESNMLLSALWQG